MFRFSLSTKKKPSAHAGSEEHAARPVRHFAHLLVATGSRALRTARKAVARPPAADPIAVANSAEVARRCGEAGLADLAAVVMASQLHPTHEAKLEAVANAIEVQGFYRISRRQCPHIDFSDEHEAINALVPAKQVGEMILARMLEAQSPEILNIVGPAGVPPSGRSAQQRYDDKGWGAAFAKARGDKPASKDNMQSPERGSAAFRSG
jgi:hypothetical protein